MYTASWLLEQNPEHLTLQLAVLSEEARVHLFIRSNQLSGQFIYFPIHRDGRKLFLLTSGIFADHTAALRRLDSLPKTVRDDGPMIRRLGPIQAMIRASGPDC